MNEPDSPADEATVALDFALHGIEIRRGVLSSEDIFTARADISLDSEKLRRTGIRNLDKKFESIARLAASPAARSIAGALLGPDPRLVRALFFDKTLERNWFVAWHQDKTVTLNRKADLVGWRSWSLKDGVCHVQPPCCVLDQMITIRLHIDPADEGSGCLKVIPESHRLGLLDHEAIERVVATTASVSCIVAAGDAVIMRPHALHSSGKSTRDGHRRVVHLEYSTFELPVGITWA